ncbi:bifunctional aminoglycoside phosphotransferase/ATP-binding protein [soil metagenome]
MSETDQTAALAFLLDPRSHAGAAGPVKRVETHGAVVFLAGVNAYKVKKAVRFPFMDQTRLESRRAACEAEVTVNRHFAADLYLGVVPITRTGDGRLEFGGSGTAVEWAVHLKRFDENNTFDLVLDRGELTQSQVADVARLIRRSHEVAKVGDANWAAHSLPQVVGESLEEILAAPDLFPAQKAERLADAMRAALREVTPLLLSRGAAGKVRRCHGDLHLRNIALLDRGPVLFDAIEFDESIATTDVLYDLAFAIVDLLEHRRPDLANALLNRYLWESSDAGFELVGLAALPLFMSLRAAIRAKIAAIRYRDVDRSDVTRQEAVRYFDTASALMAPAPRVLVAIGGVSGTGKTTVAAAIASHLGRAPGAVHLRSDIARKHHLGATEQEKLPESAYSRQITEEVFATLRADAGAALAAGQSVIVDAVHRDPEERRMVQAVADRMGARFVGLWLEAPLDVMVARVAGRTGDASDATPQVVARQAQQYPGAIDWLRIDASGAADRVIASALAAAKPEA